MVFKGKAHLFGDHINTDDIIAGKYKHESIDPAVLVKHIMENIRPGFYNDINTGDFIVAGVNFGCGSSREQAPIIIKQAGITAVLAKSFARIFYRNAINIGLLLITCDTAKIREHDEVIYDPNNRQLAVPERDICISTPLLPKEIIEISRNGGLLEFIKRNGGFYA
ncbi:3-isopropylmalate/(R)-2-methylmalate dehydratase small subunit [Fontibacillus solani]|uniref:3-isopropylmalate/(R)-2-methylmalate dehydratase small subunit n=1 Tax=Fontibacillus solani TaxID=1572857 RepID=A0A7W3SW02_9BACL|nr:3-isopropylmalate dehydratase [Fontibacillus solani]MBA9087207.1 3-isopropylmalate/(R)-2-methylmalate dehydratase small subunit [Fontibacillus solani]